MCGGGGGGKGAGGGGGREAGGRGRGRGVAGGTARVTTLHLYRGARGLLRVDGEVRARVPTRGLNLYLDRLGGNPNHTAVFILLYIFNDFNGCAPCCFSLCLEHLPVPPLLPPLLFLLPFGPLPFLSLPVDLE